MADSAPAGSAPAGGAPAGGPANSVASDRYRWVALSNTTAAAFMSALDSNARQLT